MALITCPECGKEVSDKCRACIHCGFPLINTKCNINGVVYDFAEELPIALLLKMEDYMPAIGSIRRKTSLTYTDGRELVNIIRQIRAIPESFKPKYPLEDREKLYNERIDDSSSSVECPYCHGRNTRRISGASKLANTAFFGLLGTKRYKEWHCNNCGSDF